MATDEEMLGDFADHILEVAPELITEFEAGYTPPEFSLIDGFYSCSRCRAMCHGKKGHTQWHYNLSLGIFALGATGRYLLAVHDQEEE